VSPLPPSNEVATEEEEEEAFDRPHTTRALSPPIHTAVSIESLNIPAAQLTSREITVVTAAMLQLRITDMLTWTHSNALKQQACKVPTLLVGYQVRCYLLSSNVAVRYCQSTSTSRLRHQGSPAVLADVNFTY
jgi:hypothetical protein